MSFKSGTSLVLLAACLTALTALPANAATSSAAARQNVIQSERYDRLLEANGRFRQARMRRECGPITDPQLRQSCLDSFSQYEPAPDATSTRQSSLVETSSTHDPLCRLVDGTAAASKPSRTVVVGPCSSS
jgi:hypothetical protein